MSEEYHNDNLLLIMGETGTGKSAALRNFRNPEGVMYLNCESGKKTPFPNKFKQGIVTNPYQVHKSFDKAEEMSDIHTIVVDSSTYLMDMFESQFIVNAEDGRQGWQDYQQFFKKLMQYYAAKSTKNVIILAHTMTELNEDKHLIETKIPVKGALKNQGIESYFSIAVATKKIPIHVLEQYEENNPLLNITAKERRLGFKHVFQTEVTAETCHERIRGPIGLFDDNQIYIDNDAQMLMDHINKYYN